MKFPVQTATFSLFFFGSIKASYILHCGNILMLFSCNFANKSVESVFIWGCCQSPGGTRSGWYNTWLCDTVFKKWRTLSKDFTRHIIVLLEWYWPLCNGCYDVSSCFLEVSYFSLKQ